MSPAADSLPRSGVLAPRGVWSLGLWLLSLFLGVGAIQGQTARINLLLEGTKPLQETAEIHYSRFADFQQQPIVRVGQELEDGDLLESVSGKVDLEVTCPRGSPVRFSGVFRVVIQPTASTCAFNLLNGNLDFLADEPTKVDLGGAVAGSQSTQYGVRLYRDGKILQRRILVFEGEVFTSDRKEPVRAGSQVVYEGPEPAKLGPKLEKITLEDLDGTARVYARFDVGKAILAGAAVPDPEQARSSWSSPCRASSSISSWPRSASRLRAVPGSSRPSSCRWPSAAGSPGSFSRDGASLR